LLARSAAAFGGFGLRSISRSNSALKIGSPQFLQRFPTTPSLTALSLPPSLQMKHRHDSCCSAEAGFSAVSSEISPVEAFFKQAFCLGGQRLRKLDACLTCQDKLNSLVAQIPWSIRVLHLQKKGNFCHRRDVPSDHRFEYYIALAVL
jgi:hypothetical protein